jgi:ssDNA-binding Zn-finger/Zn-ribbon topoisomerase 1
MVAPFSNKTAWWICEKDPRHVFEAAIYHVTSGAIICPICAKQRIIPTINDLQTTTPDLMAEWDWERNQALGLFPDKVASGSQTKAYWKCKKGHTWQATIASRACSQHCGCPICAKDLSASFPEKAISFYLSQCFQVEENKRFSWLKYSELDLYIPSLNLGIEYDGKIWHTDAKRDSKKDNLCQENGIHLIRVREKECPQYHSTSHKILRQSITDSGLTTTIQELFDYINHKYNFNYKITINIEKDRIQILEKILSSKKEKSVANSELIEEWNYEKNQNVSPETVNLNSHHKVWWKCKNGHEWKTAVYSRSGKDKVGCPFCSGKKILSGYNDLASLYPQIAAEWSSKNLPLLPNKIAAQSNKKFWWTCPTCNYTYEASAAHRVRGRNCPQCGKIRTITAHIKTVLCIETEEVFNGLNEAANKTGISASAIGNCCRGATKSAGGYHWKYIDKE